MDSEGQLDYNGFVATATHRSLHHPGSAARSKPGNGGLGIDVE
ncbi:hypothetical protein SynA15127_01798 [Synechococcus sp. A15-127]|nr:hypothetical protein SynA15127_01798 [Synechococcus sp. A15-127]